MPPPGVCLNIIEARYKKDGFGKFTKPQKFLGQDYEQLKQYCLTRGVSFIDETFLPDRRSIGQEILRHGILSPSELACVEWRRPAEIVRFPVLVLDGVSRFDFGQGKLGNCWFLASIGALTFQKSIFEEVVPLEQRFDENYCGIFHFRFWRFGQWEDVVIDDKLPTINGRLIFVHSKNQNEFWPALLEKAYAKVCGSYSDMIAGTPSEAMMDFTGGVHINIELSQPSPSLWGLICRAGKSNTLMGSGTPPRTSGNEILPNGLVAGHAYTVTGIKEMMSRGKIVYLVRLWNPWGKGEWKGDWSDRSPLWQTVSPEDREMCLSVADDGEFWMTFEDFCKFYADIDICGLSPDFFNESDSSQWTTSVYEGRWVAGTTAGGCLNYRDSFWTNPQCRFKICGGYSEKDGDKNIMVSLMQKPEKRNRHLAQNLHIGFFIFEYKTQRGKFTEEFFKSRAPVAQTKTYLNAREVMEFFMLKHGEYLIVPSTFNPNETASFILTIHAKSETNCYDNSGDHKHELDEKVKYEEVDAEQLQRLLNENILKGDLKSGGFSIDACRSMVALMDSGIRVSDDMLNLMALRYGASSGHMTLESFISLILRFDCMNSK
ncbi:calpain-1 catalytic subunit-like [Pundamilia nyererei]|uniref:Calpain-1 catalytic subunit-like n=1 Tax=Pundamilia nyererei TaxID=303518 RepID=A0A9Y6M5H2_9CICH|nr:PREDICTED: calpain-1 catalytic subunit-like [Pundamilia nyererei]